MLTRSFFPSAHLRAAEVRPVAGGCACPRHREQPLPRTRDPPLRPGRARVPHPRREGHARKAREQLQPLGIETIQDITQKAETLSGGQRQAIAVARAAAFGTKVVILDEPTAALGVRESHQVLELVKSLRVRGLGVILISHNMPQVFELADRIFIQRLGRYAGIVTPESHSMEDAVAIMVGAKVTTEGTVPAAQ